MRGMVGAATLVTLVLSGCQSQWEAFDSLLERGLEVHRAAERNETERAAIVEELGDWAETYDIDADVQALVDHALWSARFPRTPGSAGAEPGFAGFAEFAEFVARLDRYVATWDELRGDWTALQRDLDRWQDRHGAGERYHQAPVAFKQQDGGPPKVECELITIDVDDDGELWICFLVDVPIERDPTDTVFCVWRCIVIPLREVERVEETLAR